jgi:hypothetical protein
VIPCRSQEFARAGSCLLVNLAPSNLTFALTPAILTSIDDHTGSLIVPG